MKMFSVNYLGPLTTTIFPYTAGFMIVADQVFSPGSHNFLLRIRTRDPCESLAGVADKGGAVTYEALGLNGAEAGVLLMCAPNELALYVQPRNPGLIVLAYGTNEASDQAWKTESYRDMNAPVISSLQHDAPTTSIFAIRPPIVGLIWAADGVRSRTFTPAWVAPGICATRFTPRSRKMITCTLPQLATAALFRDLIQQFGSYQKSRVPTEQVDHGRPN